jgi:hypothetical protein
VRLLRLLFVATAALTAAVALAAYRRSAGGGGPFGAELRAVAGEWSCPSLRERARRAALDGLHAAELRADAADRELGVAVPAR